MTKVADVYKLIDSIAPFSTQMDFDNSGILIGDANANVTKVGVCLDITKSVVARAIENGCDLLVSHHPVIFDKLSSVTADSITYMLVRNGINAICAHTNLDCAIGGVNDRLAIALGIENAEKLKDDDYPEAPPCPRLGTIEPISPVDFAQFVKARLNSPDVRFYSDAEYVSKVCVYGGAGSHYILQAKAAGADTLVTSELKHHQWLLARELDLTVIDAGHFSTENVVVKPIALLLQSKLDCEVKIIAQSAPYKAI